jgi:hypothetical protein
MSRTHRTVGLILTALLTLAAGARGQEVAGRGHRLGLVTGLLLMSEHDGNASPLRYGGSAPLLQLGYVTRGARSRLAIRVGGARGTLTSSLTMSGVPSEHAAQHWIEAQYVRVLGSGAGTMRWLAGATVSVRGSARDHFYADPSGDVVSFSFFSAALDPTVLLERAFGQRGTMTVELGVPLLALVRRPYSDERVTAAGAAPLRVASLSSFTGADLSLAYARLLGRSADLIVGYRAIVQRHASGATYRSVNHALSLALAVRLWGAP